MKVRVDLIVSEVLVDGQVGVMQVRGPDEAVAVSIERLRNER